MDEKTVSFHNQKSGNFYIINQKTGIVHIEPKPGQNPSEEIILGELRCDQCPRNMKNSGFGPEQSKVSTPVDPRIDISCRGLRTRTSMTGNCLP